MKPAHYILFIIMLYLLAACGDQKNIVKLADTNFEEEIPLTGTLVFTFDKEIVSDTSVNYWDSTKYILFDPPIEGRFKWRSTTELMFSPSGRLLPATNYTGKLTDKLLKEKKGYKLDKNTTFQFHTPYLQFEEAAAYWTKEENSEATLAYLDLDFNYPVNPHEVAKRLLIKADDEARDFKISDNSSHPIISVSLPDLELEDRDIDVSVILKKGLKPVNGGTAISEDLEKDIKIPSPFKLTVYEISAKHDGMQGEVIVNTSQEISKEKVKDYISLSPDVSYTVVTSPQSFTIKSEDFNVEDTYEVIIKEGLRGKIGGILKYDYVQEISFGELSPSIRFTNQKGMFLSGKGFRNLAVNIINVPEVQVKVRKIYKNNLLSYLSKTRYNYYYDEYEYGGYGTEHLGDVIWEKTYQSMTLPKKGGIRLLKLDFEDQLDAYKGIYEIEVASKEDYWLKAKKLVAISDIGIIAKEGTKSISFFVNSIESAEPLANIELSLIGQNNQQIETLKTDANGVAVYSLNQPMKDGFQIAMVTAKHKKDFNYLPFSQSMVNTSRFEVGGKRDNKAGYDAFIYGDRDIYRPGEAMHISAVIRDSKWQIPGQIPVKLKLIMPNGRTFKTIRKTLNAHGSIETSIQLPVSTLTGTYTAELYTSNDILLNAKNIAVEEFMPDRIKVNARLDKAFLEADDSLNVYITATNFFGPPAAGRNYEIEMAVKRKTFRPKDFSDYNFSIEGENYYFQKTVRSQKTDQNGMAREGFHIPENYAHTGLLQGDFFITVFDETGRPVNRKKSIDIYTQDIFFGLKQMRYYYQTGQAIKVPIVALDKDKKPLHNIQARVQLIKHEYRTVLSRSGNYFRYKSAHEERVITDKTIKVNESNSYFSFTPEYSGKYEIRVSTAGANSYVSQTFYAYGWGRTNYSSFQVNNEGHIDISFDKESYQVGDKAKVILKTPFSGKMLVTVESNQVVDHFYLSTDKRAASFDLPIKDKYVPNVYITATLFRPHKVSELPLTVAHGFAPVFVTNPSNRLPVAIEAAGQSRSRTKQKIKVKTQPHAALTIAVVDEGILQLTGYETPDPYHFFYRKRALEVSTYNMYPYLFPEISSKISTPGGGGMNLEKRVNPLTSKRVNLLAFWSGILKADSKGEATYEIDIPQFSGDLRIMAVTYKDKSFAATHTNMKVADPIVISTALPRFFSPGDTVEVPVTINNTTGKKANCRARLSVNNALYIIGKDNRSLALDANSEGQVVYQVVAKPEIGQALVKVNVDALGERFLDETNITVRPASPLQKRNGSGMIKAGMNKTIRIDSKGFIPESVDKRLVLSTSPLVQFHDDLAYLVGYPHGCVEQTVSKAFPQIYFQDMAKSILKKKKLQANPNYYVQEAIKKLSLMQLYNGGLTYWPGGGYESWWGSVYAAHFLWEAKKAGFAVDEKMLGKLLAYLKTKLKEKKTITYYYNGNKEKRIAPKEVAYSLYVLALVGKAPLSTMNYYKSHHEQLSLDGKYLLAAAYALSGDEKKYKEIIPAAFEGEKANTSLGGSFYSYIRDEAIALNALLETDPDNPQVGIMARHISEQLKNKKYLNTQERAFGFLAMGKIARKASQTQVTATLSSGGKKIADFENKDLTLNTIQIQSSDIEIVTKGAGQLYYFWDTEGINADGSYKEEDNYLMVRKQFYDRYGRQIADNTFRQNDLVVVRLAIKSAVNRVIENVVITDILPAGFEIENPRINEIPGTEWIKKQSHPDYRDIRDDRINLFVNAGPKEQYYYYVVRAVSRGTFEMGPVSADAMYNGEYHSYHGGGQIRVVKR